MFKCHRVLLVQLEYMIKCRLKSQTQGKRIDLNNKIPNFHVGHCIESDIQFDHTGS